MEFRKTLGATLSALAISISGATSASAADWDDLGYGSFQWSSSGGSYLTRTVQSGGGYFKICVSSNDDTATYTIWESDPDNPDDYVGSYNLGWGGCATHYVQSFVDGTNGQAELYVETRSQDAGEDVDIHFYD